MNSSSRKKNPEDETLRPADLAQLKAAGISKAQVLRQVALFQKAGHHRELHRPCTIGDGIHRISPAEARSLIPLQEEAAGAGRFLKFVPASGAASRMFEALHHYHRQSEMSRIEQIRERAARGGARAQVVIRFLEEWERFPFSEDLKEKLLAGGLTLGRLTQGDRWRKVLNLLVAEDVLAARRAAWTPPPPRYPGGVFAKYAALVSSASDGAITTGARMRASLPNA